MLFKVHFELKKCYALFDPSVGNSQEPGFSIEKHYNPLCLDISISKKMLDEALDFAGVHSSKYDEVRGNIIDSTISIAYSHIHNFAIYISNFKSIYSDLTDGQKDKIDEAVKQFENLGNVINVYCNSKKPVGELIFKKTVASPLKNIDIDINVL